MLHVPEIRRKLISISATTELGNKFSGDGEKLVISNPAGQVILVAHKEGNLYKLAMESGSAYEAAASDEADIELLHERFGDIN